jgi:hypothetical protein
MSSFIKNYGKDILLLLTGGIIYLLSVYNFGSGITDDSINYLSAASSFPNELLKVDGTLYVEWPPLFPILLSLYKLTGMSAADFAMIFQGIVFVLNLILTGRLLQPAIHSRYIHFIAMVFLVFSIPLLQSHVFIWSESAFIFLLLLNVYVLVKYLETEKIIYFVYLIFLSMLMSLERKTGLYFIINFGISLLILSPQKSLTKKCLYSFFYMSIAVLPFILWTFRKYKISGRVFESAYIKPEKLAVNLEQLLNTISSWLLPNEIPLAIRISVIIIFIFLIFYIFRSHINLSLVFKGTLIKVSFISLAGYLILLPLTFIYIHGETMDDRILSPVYIIGLMSAFLFIDSILENVPANYPAKKGLMILMTISLCYPIMRTIYHIKKWNTYGTGGYNTSTLKNSKMIAWLKTHETSMPIRSNNVYLLNYYLNYCNETHRKITNGNIKDNSFLLVSFSPSLNKNHDFNYIGKEEILYKTNEGFVILIKK